jgi:regulator of sirC expression with transglutaminase-like and TPR domain
MATASAKTVSDELRDSEKAALVKLLGDEDPAVHKVVRGKIMACGAGARSWLRPHALSSDPLIRRRTQEIVRHFDQQSADNDFLAFCLQNGVDLDLEHGAWLLAQTQYPDINVEAYSALLDSFAAELKQRLESVNRTQSVLTRINEYVFNELRFKGNEQKHLDPENSYLNRVIDRRSGNPINLCLVYLLLARRLKLPMTGVGLPGHFVCRYQSASDELYVDVFSQGKLLTKADCIHYLVRGNYDLKDEYLTPVSSRQILGRICNHLHQIYVRLNQTEDATRFQRYVVALSR